LAAAKTCAGDHGRLVNQDGRADTGGAVKFNLFTVTVANALCVPRRGCRAYTGLEF